MKIIQVRRTRHAKHCWGSKGQLISDMLLWTPSHGRAKAGRPASIYIQQRCADTEYSFEDLPGAINDSYGWWKRVREIPAGSDTSWWKLFNAKSNIYIYIYIYRALNICSDFKIENELKSIKNIFIENGYPEEVIDVNIRHTVTKFKSMNKFFGPPKCPVYFRLPWVGSASQSFADKIASSANHCYHAVNLRPIFTPRPAFNSTNKDKLPIFKQSNLIYKFVYFYFYKYNIYIILYIYIYNIYISK